MLPNNIYDIYSSHITIMFIMNKQSVFMSYHEKHIKFLYLYYQFLYNAKNKTLNF